MQDTQRNATQPQIRQTSDASRTPARPALSHAALFALCCAFALVCLLPLLTAGCGGGSKTEDASASGRVVVTFRWPDLTQGESRAIPRRAKFLRVQIKQDGTPIQTATRERPATQGATTETIPFTDVPRRSGISIQADAYASSPDGGAVSMATATKSNIDGKPISLTLGSTVDSLKVTPTDVSLRVGDVETVIVEAHSGPDLILLDPAEIEAPSALGFNVQKATDSLTLTVTGVSNNISAQTITVKHNRTDQGGDNNPVEAKTADLHVRVTTRLTITNLRSGLDTFVGDVLSVPGRTSGQSISFRLLTDNGLSAPSPFRISVQGIIAKPGEFTNGEPSGSVGGVEGKYSLKYDTTSLVNEYSSGTTVSFTPGTTGKFILKIVDVNDNPGSAQLLSVYVPVSSFSLNTPARVLQGDIATLTALNNNQPTGAVTFSVTSDANDDPYILPGRRSIFAASEHNGTKNSITFQAPLYGPTTVDPNDPTKPDPNGGRSNKDHKYTVTATDAAGNTTSEDITVPKVEVGISPTRLTARTATFTANAPNAVQADTANALFSVDGVQLSGGNYTAPIALQPDSPGSDGQVKTYKTITVRATVTAKAVWDTTFTSAFANNQPVQIPVGSISGTIQ